MENKPDQSRKINRICRHSFLPEALVGADDSVRPLREDCYILGDHILAAQKRSGPDWRWIVTIFAITVCISALMSLVSTNLLSSATLAVSFVILICIIAIGIVFDIIGVAVTACPDAPFHAMASRKVPEAPDALRLLRSANRVSSFCNDVIGDICGVISGAASAVIASQIAAAIRAGNGRGTVISLGLSALVAALTVGGKALGKTVAMGSSVQVVRTTAKVLCFFRTIFARLRRR